LLLISGALLLTPGFFTDLIGFAFLVPNIRQKIAKIIIEKYLVQTLNPSSSKLHETLEGDFTRED
jgi:UPF0716 protein FxsA